MTQKKLNKFLIFSLLMLLPISLVAQNIKGKLTDASGEVLPFMNVVVQGTTNGTTSNENGEFSLTVKELPVNLVLKPKW